jgi:seryl-tRNA(Sec) selenium transferase
MIFEEVSMRIRVECETTKEAIMAKVELKEKQPSLQEQLKLANAKITELSEMEQHQRNMYDNTLNKAQDLAGQVVQLEKRVKVLSYQTMDAEAYRRDLARAVAALEAHGVRKPSFETISSPANSQSPGRI